MVVAKQMTSESQEQAQKNSRTEIGRLQVKGRMRLKRKVNYLEETGNF
jgi:hypothetical protein